MLNISSYVQINNFSACFSISYIPCWIFYLIYSLYDFCPVCLCVSATSASSLRLLSFLFLCVSCSCFSLLFAFLYCLTVFLCLAAPCALTSHLWRTVCPMCHITLARTFVFGSFFYLIPFFPYSHNIYSIIFLVFFCVFISLTLCDSPYFHDVWT